MNMASSGIWKLETDRRKSTMFFQISLLIPSYFPITLALFCMLGSKLSEVYKVCNSHLDDPKLFKSMVNLVYAHLWNKKKNNKTSFVNLLWQKKMSGFNCILFAPHMICVWVKLCRIFYSEVWTHVQTVLLIHPSKGTPFGTYLDNVEKTYSWVRQKAGLFASVHQVHTFLAAYVL